MQLKSRFPSLAFVLVIALVAQGCASAQRVERAEDVAAQGEKLATILPGFYNEYYESAIRADSVTLSFIREEPGTTAARLRNQLQEANDDLKQTGVLVEGLTEHVVLLRDYFWTLRRLAGDKSGEELGSVTKDLIKAMAAVRAQLADQRKLGMPVEKAGGPGGNFIVVSSKSAALREELEAHGPVIDAELAVQEEVLRALGESMTSNQELWASAGLETPLFESYERGKQTLSRDWIDRRVELLTQPENIATAMEAEKAMAALRLAWRELAGGGPEISTLIRLQNRIDATQKLIAALAR